MCDLWVYLFVVTCRDPKTPVKITLLPFYGGAKGQTLQITESADGTVNTEVIQGQLPFVEPEVEVEAVENPVLPVRRESDYGQNIKNIHRSALNIIRLQESAKNKGLNQQEEVAYKEYMETLNQSAHNLAKIYEGDTDDDDSDAHTRAGLSGWFARKKAPPPKKENKDKDKDKDKDKKKEEEDKKKQALTPEETKKKEEEAKKKAAEEAKKRAEEAKKKTEAEAIAKRKAEEEGKKKAEEEKKRKEEENKKKQQQEKEQEQHAVEDDDEATPQQPETSVAEAKPVGLAVAGIGGVASSKPVATAVVGPGGLAIARPVGTAIAGVSPDQALVPIYAEGYVVPKPSATKDKKPSHSTDYLNKIISKYHQV